MAGQRDQGSSNFAVGRYLGVYMQIGGETCRWVPFQVETSGGLLADASGKINGFYGLMRDRSGQIGITEALRQSEDSYLSFLSLAPVAATIGRLEDGRYLYVNEAFCQKTGYRREEAIGRSPLELDLYVHPENRENLLFKCNNTAG